MDVFEAAELEACEDGWYGVTEHTDVYVEGGKVVRGTKPDRNGCPVPAAIYRRCGDAWTNVSGQLTPRQFARGARSGELAIM